MAFAFPGTIEPRLVADGAFGEAYDALAAGERSVLKTAIARMAAVQGTADAGEKRSSSAMRQGFRLYEDERPAPWVLVMWDGAYVSPSRVLAALIPAMLAGVSEIMACRVTDGPGLGAGAFPAPVLAALELGGQELVAACGTEEALALIAHCCGEDSRGRLVFLGADRVFERAARLAAAHGTPCRHMAGPVRIGIATSSFTRPVSTDHLRLAHPDAVFVPFEGGVAEGGFSAVFCAEEAVPDYLGSAPLVLSPGNEAYWHWPDVCRDFFRVTSQGIGPSSD